MANADLILIEGSNMAECHPVGFQWVTEAKARGAKVIHIDPRFTRTSAVADKHIPIRGGSDIVFLGALINHVLTTESYFRDYVVAYTNAATIVSDDFVDTEELDGLFSGYDPTTGQYDQSSWQYKTPPGKPDQGTSSDEKSGSSGHQASGGAETHGSGGPTLAHSAVLRDETLTDPMCVLQIMKRHYARYTPEMVEEVCGVSKEDFALVAREVVANSGRERTTMFAYAVGWTQHVGGAQMIRTAAILQLLMGNVGRPGAGIMALRGHATIQGSTDIPTLFNLLPGYLPMPRVSDHETLEDYIDSIVSKDAKGYWANADKYAVSLLKAWYGENATSANNFGLDYMPRLSGAHGTYQTVMGMIENQVEGYFVLGQNPAVGSANARMQREGLRHLKWLVVRDFQLIETATFWKDAPEIASGEWRSEDIDTEVFFFPAATHVEKAGTFTQTQRLVQWRHKAVNPPGDAQSELDFFHEVGVRIRARLADSSDPIDEPLKAITWDYPKDEHGEVIAESVMAEINGTDAEGKPLATYADLKADGSTTSGCWIYAGIYKDGVNQAARRKPGYEQDETAAEWAWAWPANRRTLYNRASADREGKPWSERKKLIWWDEEKGQWVGKDNPDFPLKTAPSYRPKEGVGGPDGLAGDDPFIMMADGKGWLYAPLGLVDGPMPTHYEAAESPMRNPLYSQQSNPTRVTFRRKDNLNAPSEGTPGGDVYPYVFQIGRLTEHHTAGGMSRWLPYLSELQPSMFIEVSPDLAAEKGLENGDWATVVSARAAIEARVLVTDRMVPLKIGGRMVHQIGMPYHWGSAKSAQVHGDSANDLLGVVLDRNTQIQEGKMGMCDIRPGRRPQDRDEYEQLVSEYQSRAGVTVETGNEICQECD
ncbi:MAG TPA: formate dehydrogenase [Dermacoccus sp.]|nr:formate dehydrogenase [Dermacoccus sp.]